MENEKLKTLQVLPRTYGLGTRNRNGVHIVYPITSFLTAAVQLSGADSLENDIGGWQKHRAYLQERTKRTQHTRPDSPIFSLTGKESKFLDLKPAEVKDILLEAILDKEDAMNLWEKDIYNSAIKKGHYGTYNLSGEVTSKSNARGRKAHRKVHINNPNLNRDGTLGINEFNCECDDSYYNDMRHKLYGVFCHHAAALQIAYYNEVKSDKEGVIEFENKKPLNPALPFNITNYNSEAISFLNIEFLISRYIRKKSLFEINRKLTRLGSLLFTPAINSMLDTGDMWFEVVRTAFKKTKDDPKYIEETKGLLKNMREYLRDEDFYPRGYSIEYEGSDFESIGERWEHKDKEKCISLIYKQDMPLHFILKKYQGYEVDLFGDRKITLLEGRKSDVTSRHPYSRIGKEFMEIDDMTRRYCRAKIILPGTVRNTISVPESVSKRYQDTVGLYS